MPAPAAAAAVVGQVVGALSELPGKIKGFVDSLVPFVEAADPSAVRAMNDAMRSLYATVGFALVPVVQGFTQLVKEVAGELFQPFTDLREIVSELTGQAVAIVRPFVVVFGDAVRNAVADVQAMMPVIEVVTATLEGLANVVAVVNRITGALSAAFVQSFLSFGDLSGVVDAVRDSFLKATIAIVRFTDATLRAFGFTQLANQLLRGFAREQDRGRPGALQNVQVTDLQSVYRQRLQAAASAGAGADLQQQSVDYLKEIRDVAKDLLKNGEKQEKNGSGLLGFLKRLFGGGRPEPRPNPWPNRQDGDNRTV